MQNLSLNHSMLASGDLDRVLRFYQENQSSIQELRSYLGSEASCLRHLELGIRGSHEASEPDRLLALVIYQDIGEAQEILLTATHCDFRRQGVMRGLLREYLSAQRQPVWLEVRADNLAALSLYRGLGFEEVGRRPSYYGPGQDALLMTWEAHIPCN